MRVKQEDLKNVKEYLKDKDKFYVLSQIIRGKSSKLYSDLEKSFGSNNASNIIYENVKNKIWNRIKINKNKGRGVK